MKESIAIIRKLLFKHEITLFFDEIILLLENLKLKSIYLSDLELNLFHDLMESINNFIRKNDFLAVVDIIEFELLPIFEKKEN